MTSQPPLHHQLMLLVRNFNARFPVKTFPSTYDPPSIQKPTLYIYGPGWKNHWGSFDAECLKWQVYLKFLKYDFDIVNCNEPLMSPSGSLPFLLLPTGEAIHGDQITKYLSKQIPDNPHLDSHQSSDQLAFLSLIDTKLQPAITYALWVEAKNFERVTGPKYCAHYVYPLNKLLEYQMKGAAVAGLLAKKTVVIREEIYEEAAQALEALSLKLDENPEFRETSDSNFLGAAAFAYIHTILTTPFVETTLGNLVRKHQNLVEFARQVGNDVFEKV